MNMEPKKPHVSNTTFGGSREVEMAGHPGRGTFLGRFLFRFSSELPEHTSTHVGLKILDPEETIPKGRQA